MASARLKDPHYKNYHDIRQWHGLFVAFFYWLFRLSKLTPYRIWLWFPEKIPEKIGFLKRFKRFAWNARFEKATPCWHDMGVILLVGLTCGAILGSWSQQNWLSIAAWWVAWLLLVDMLAYHIRVLWFDDLEIGRSSEYLKVWSHRRIFFQALINFIQSLCLFAVFYHRYKPTESFWTLLQTSFTIATTLTQPDSLKALAILVDLQVGVAIFFLVVVISVVASIGYNRPELGKSFDE
ncbi:MAG: hypothetical protein MUP30_02715 [Deltaproteobacteria bacterium]|nr:hypothetical protein [Deltaproteobacteria bacterium]